MCSDHIFLGGRIISRDEFKLKFPEWYENGKRASGEKGLRQYCFIPDYSHGISASLNAIYSIDYENATAEYLCSFESERKEGGLYFPPIRTGNILTFSPLKGERWAFYNLDTGTWFYEDVPSEFLEDGEIVIKMRVVIDNLLVHVSENPEVVIVIDLFTQKISYYDCLDRIRQSEGNSLKFSTVIAYGDSVLLFTATGNEVYEFDTRSMQIIKTHKIPLECSGIQQAVVAHGTDCIYLLEHVHASRIIKWDIKNGIAEEIADLPIHSNDNLTPGPIWGLCNDFSGLYIIPRQDKCVVRVDCCENKAIRIELHTEINLLERKDLFYERLENRSLFTILAYNGYRNMFTAFIPYDYSIAEIDFEKGIFLNKRKWRVNGIEKMVRDSLKSQVDGVHMENQFFGLKEFVDDLKEEKL